MAVDAAGNLYVTDCGNNRVLKLAAGSSTQTVLPFTGLNDPSGVAVDTAGNLYVADYGQQSGAETGGGLDHPDRAAVHRPQQPRRCGGGHRRQRLRHRLRQQSGAETAGGVMRRTAGARGCRASPTTANDHTACDLTFITAADPSTVQALDLHVRACSRPILCTSASAECTPGCLESAGSALSVSHSHATSNKSQ